MRKRQAYRGGKKMKRTEKIKKRNKDKRKK